MKFELVNLTSVELELYNVDPISANGTKLIYDSLNVVENLGEYAQEYKINNLSQLVNEGKLGVKWNDYLIDSQYGLDRLKYEFDFYYNNIIRDKYLKADFLRKKRQLVVSYLQFSGSSVQVVRDLLDHYKSELELYIQGGTNDLSIAVENETTQPFLTYLNIVVGVIPYTNDLETIKDSILRNIK